MKTIKDSVHSHIDVEGVARALLDTPAVQRLRRIRQLGTVSLVYPSANHTRFEHSLGVYYLADRALAELPIHDRRAEHLRAAALLHDIGHSPFSHNIERVIKRHTGKAHDDVADIVTVGEIGDVLRDHDLDPELIAEIIAGNSKYGSLISGELDVDRMDYLVRDAHHTGVPYGTIDHERLVRALTFIDGQLVLTAGNVQTAESLLIARALMNPTVYNHHVARISKSMLRRATERLLTETEVTAGAIRRMDDPELRSTLRNHQSTAADIRRIDHRNLFKRALWVELANVPEPIVDADQQQQCEWERRIATDAGIDRTDVILDIPDRPRMIESGSRVMVSGEIRRLDEESPLVDALRAAQRAQWRLGVYAPADQRERVRHAAVETLGIDVEGPPINDVQGYPATLDRFVDSDDEAGTDTGTE